MLQAPLLFGGHAVSLGYMNNAWRRGVTIAVLAGMLALVIVSAVVK